jgi:hypothetical protein
VNALGARDLRKKYLPKPAPGKAIPSAGSDPSDSGAKDGTEGQVDIDGEDTLGLRAVHTMREKITLGAGPTGYDRSSH